MAVCLIAGGAGFIGSHLAEALVARGDTVRVVDNFSDSQPENLADLGPRVDVVPGDLRSHTLVRRAMAGVDEVYHFAVPWGLAAPGPVQGPAAGAVGTWHLLLAARDAGCRRVVLASTGEVYGRAAPPVAEDTPTVPALPGARDALMAEQEAVSFARSFGLPLVRLRFFNVYGPRQGLRAAGPNVRRILGALLTGKRPVLYDHELAEQDLLYVADAVRGCLMAAGQDRAAGQVYHIASGRAVRAIDVVARLNRLLGTDVPPLLAGPCSTAPPAPLPDVGRARRDLGFAAETTLDDGLRRCVDYYRPPVAEASAPPLAADAEVN
jgi:UDP-glucose 4-epimerase